MDARETELIKRAQRGSAEAFDELVRLHDRRILQMIYSIVGDRQDAGDVYQETFIRAFSRISTFRFESELSTWLGRIAINLALNWRKRMHRKNVFSLEAQNESAEDSPREIRAEEEGAVDALLSRELNRQVESGLRRLPAQQRTVFILKHTHGYKIKEIAEMLGCAEGTVKNQLFRAAERLRQILQPYLETPT